MPSLAPLSNTIRVIAFLTIIITISISMKSLYLLLFTLVTVLSSDYRVSSTFTNLSHIVLNLDYTGTDDYYIK